MPHDFINALESYVASELRAGGQPADYNNEALQIIDARNAVFRNVGRRPTDESDDVYALRDLCRVDEATMELVPDRERLARIARNYF